MTSLYDLFTILFLVAGCIGAIVVIRSRAANRKTDGISATDAPQAQGKLNPGLFWAAIAGGSLALLAVVWTLADQLR